MSLPPRTVAAVLPAGVTLWVQDLVHSGRHVYGLSLRHGEPRTPGLWRVAIDTGEISFPRFVSAAGDCRFPLNSFELAGGALSAAFFCPAGCDASPCLAGELHGEKTPIMPYRGKIEDEWRPALWRGTQGTIEGYRYHVEEIALPQEGEPGRLVLRRGDVPFRGRAS